MVGVTEHYPLLMGTKATGQCLCVGECGRNGFRNISLLRLTGLLASGNGKGFFKKHNF